MIDVESWATAPDTIVFSPTAERRSIAVFSRSNCREVILFPTLLGQPELITQVWLFGIANSPQMQVAVALAVVCKTECQSRPTGFLVKRGGLTSTMSARRSDSASLDCAIKLTARCSETQHVLSRLALLLSTFPYEKSYISKG
jgi:hypothetical protein